MDQIVDDLKNNLALSFYCHGRTASGKHNVKETVPVLQAISRLQLLHSILQVTGMPKTLIKTKVDVLSAHILIGSFARIVSITSSIWTLER